VVYIMEERRSESFWVCDADSTAVCATDSTAVRATDSTAVSAACATTVCAAGAATSYSAGSPAKFTADVQRQSRLAPESATDDYGSAEYHPDHHDANHVRAASHHELRSGQSRSITRSGFVRPRSDCDFSSYRGQVFSGAGHHVCPTDFLIILIVIQRWTRPHVFPKHVCSTFRADKFDLRVWFSGPFRSSTDGPQPTRSLHARRLDP